ncbi:MAG: glycosyltransferase [Gammaproteobacteria bacterium]
MIAKLDTGGAEHALLRLARRCRERRVEQRVFALLPGGSLVASYQSSGLEPTLLDLRRAPLRSAARLVSELREWRPDVVQTWMYHADVLGGLAARWAGCPVVWGVRQTSIGEVATSTSVAWMYRAARALSAHVPSAVVFNARAASVSHRRFGFRHAVSHVVHNGLDIQALGTALADCQALRRELGIPDDALLLGHLGRFTPEKDHPTLLRAFAAAASTRPALRLVAAGRGVDGANSALAAEVHASGLAGRVHFLGDRSDPLRVLAGLDLFVLSSLHEGFPNALLEAMALGLPCVTTDCGDAAHLAGTAAHVVARGDAQALARAIGALADMTPSQRQRQGAACAARVARRFGVDAMCDGFESVWHEVARKHQGNKKGSNHVRHCRTSAG